METSSNPRVLSWAFEIAYLELGGIGPVLDRCPQCGDKRIGGVYLASHGGVVCDRCAPASATASVVSAGTVRTLQAMREFDLGRLERLRVADASRRQIAALLREHISYHLDVGLRSEKFVEGLESWRRSTPRRPDSDAPGDDGSDQ
jgi:DNA repair protein RecO (recombination protein O)